MLTMKKNRTRLIGPAGVVAGVAMLAPAGSVAGQCEYDVTVIQAPECPPYGFPPTTGLGINKHGHVVGHYFDLVALHDRAFLWTPEEGFVTLPLAPGAYDQSAEDINDRGVIVGTATLSGVGDRGFVYKDGQYTILPPAQGKGWSSAIAVNNKGEVAGTRSIGDGVLPENAYFWSEATGFIDLGLMDSTKSQALAINDAGWVVGRRGIVGSTDEAFLWDRSGLVILGPIPGGFNSSARGINNAGQIVCTGHFHDDQGEIVGAAGYAWVDGQWISLPLLPGDDSSSASDINDLAQITGTTGIYADTEDRPPILWQYRVPSDLLDLLPPDFGEIDRLSGINNVGQILAYGEIVPGYAVAYLLTPKDRPDGDVDCNCTVNVSDLLWILQDWHKTHSVADVNDDGIVDVLDLLIVLADWS